MSIAAPDILKVAALASLLGVSETWVYRRSTPRARDPIPRCPGFGRPRFNRRDPHFQRWVLDHFGPVDLGVPYVVDDGEPKQ